MDASIAAPAHAAAAPAFDNDRKVRLGMLFYVLTDVTFVIFLLVSYVWLRAYNTGGGWFPFAGMALPDATTSALLVLLIVLSAVAYAIGQIIINTTDNSRALGVFAGIALILTVVTLVWQIRFMGQQQFAAADGSFASTWLILSGYHVYHLFFGTFFGLGLTVRALKGRYSRARHLGVTTIGYFWYWMALMPVIVWVMMLVLPPNKP